MSDDISILYSPFDLQGIPLANRFVMSPMTRSRAPAHGVPDDLTVRYYTQRAGAGLVISEATCILPGGTGTTGVPCIYEPEHIEGWRRVTDSVHAAGGHLFVQLWHTGRVSIAEWQPDGRAPIGPSAIVANATVHNHAGIPGPPDTPREATLDEIAWLVEGYAQGARNAIAAGADGVEIHACNGYLIQQFLSDVANHRTDAYGGSIERRMRFAIEVIDAVVAAVGAKRTGIRISPHADHQGSPITDATEIFPPLVSEINRRGLAYVHCVEGRPGTPFKPDDTPSVVDFKAFRRLFDGVWIANNSYTPESAAEAIRLGHADLISFGRPFVANPDYVERVRLGAGMNEIDMATIYVGFGEGGYTDYPALPT